MSSHLPVALESFPSHPRPAEQSRASALGSNLSSLVVLGRVHKASSRRSLTLVLVLVLLGGCFYRLDSGAGSTETLGLPVSDPLESQKTSATILKAPIKSSKAPVAVGPAAHLRLREGEQPSRRFRSWLKPVGGSSTFA